MLKESAILNTIASLLPDHQVLSDDAYLDEASGFIFTTDMLVENRHFSMNYFSPQDLGWKACAVNLSDVAALGGTPRFLLISLGLPSATSMDFVEGFYQGFQALLNQTGGMIIGGDTVGSEQLVINVTAIGQMEAETTAGRRNLAIVGDVIVTTGWAGLSAVGLQAFQQNEPEWVQAKQAHLRPIPRLAEGQLLARTFKRYGLMDSSDGLADAVIKLARESNVCIELEADKLPVHPEILQFATTHGADPLKLMLYGGEDFELVAALPAAEFEANSALLQGFQPIGRVVAGPSEALLVDSRTGSSESLDLEKTYQHFAAEKEPPHGK